MARSTPSPGVDLEQKLKELVMATRCGDKAAYAELLRLITPLLRRGASAYLVKFGRVGHAEDAVQETLLAVHLKLHTYDEALPFLNWIRVVLRHKMVDFLRRNRVPVTSIDDIEFWEPEGDNNVEQDTVTRDLQKLLDRLRPPAGSIIHALKIEGASVKELAVQYNMTESNIKVIVHRGLQKLADLVRTREAA